MGGKIDETEAAELLWSMRSFISNENQQNSQPLKDDNRSSQAVDHQSNLGNAEHPPGHSPLRMPQPVENCVPPPSDPRISTSSSVLAMRSRTVSVGSVNEGLGDHVLVRSIGSVPSLVFLDPLPQQATPSLLPPPSSGTVAATTKVDNSSVLLLDHHDWRDHHTSSPSREVIQPMVQSTEFPDLTASSSTERTRGLDVKEVPLPLKKRKKVTLSSASVSSSPSTELRKWQSFVGETTKHPNIVVRATLRRKFNWKQYPELEEYLVTHREEYFEHSARNYTAEQRKYNNDLTRGLLDVAAEEGYVFEEFTFPMLRDRIRCYYKSYSQAVKKKVKLESGMDCEE